MSERFTIAVGAATLLVLTLAGPMAAQQQPGAMQAERTIRVSGMGDVQVTPDEARITFAVETLEETAQAAGEENARRMDRLVRALTGAGIPRGDIETQHYRLHPEYVHEEGRREPRIRGYRAMNQVVVKTRDLGRSGELIDIALAAGANRVDGINFVVTDPSTGRAEALAEAVQRARLSAEAIAGALGVRLGAVLDASTEATPAPVVQYRQRMDVMETAAAAPPTPIEPGEQTLSARVFVVYAIEGGR